METDPERSKKLERKGVSRVASVNKLGSSHPREQIAAAPPAAPLHPAGWASLLGQKIWHIAEPLSLALLFGFLLWKSWRRWPEPLVDFSRYLYAPWRMSQGALLYRELVDVYGPLPLLVQDGAFRLLGPGLDVIIGLNIVVTVGILALVRGIFRTIGDGLSGWLCGVVFLVVFAVPCYPNSDRSLFNYIAPYSCEATWGLGGVLLTVYALLRHAVSGRRRWLLGAGLGLGIAFLDKPELLLAALGALGTYLGLALLQAWRQGRAEGAVKPGLVQFAGWLGGVLAGFLAAYLPVFLVLAHAGGWAYGFRAANGSLQLIFDPAYVRVAMTHYQSVMMGFDHPWTNLLNHLQWGLALIGFCVVAGWAGWGWRKAQEAGEPGRGFVGVMMALGFLVVLFTDWLAIGRALLLPTVLAVVITAGGSLRAAWQGRAGRDRLAGLAVVAMAAMLLLVRILLNVRIYNYGFFLSVLAALLLVHVLVYEIPLGCGRAGKSNSLLQIAFALLVIMGTAQLGRLSLAMYGQRNFPVGQGRDRFYSFTREINDNGVFLNQIVKVIQDHFGQVKTVVAFPESMGVNYYLRKINPVADMQFHPDVLRLTGPDKIVAELTAHPPEAVVLFALDLTEYDAAYFGADDASGKSILDWVKSNYAPAYIAGNSSFSATGHAIDIYIRRDLVPAYSGGSQ